MRELFKKVLRWLALAVLFLVAVAAVVLLGLIWVPRHMVQDRGGPDELRYVEQGWTSSDRARYYYTPQGTSMKGLRYRWFTSLEVPIGKQLFADPNHLRAYGFLVDPSASPVNPDHLPVGFTH